MCKDAINWLVKKSLSYCREKQCKNKKEFIRNICNEIRNVDIPSILSFLNLDKNINLEDERDLSKKVEKILEESLKRMKKMVAEPYRNRLDYHCQEAEAMLATYRNFEKIIGTNHHNQTDGYHCEVLLKTYLRKHLCKRYSIDTGFICTDPSLNDFEDEEYIEGLIHKEKFKQASKQIDILIHDTIDYENIYSIEDCVCVIPKKRECYN